MTCKLNINLSQGSVEAEGSEEFVMNIYNDFKDRMGNVSYSPQNTGQQKQPPANESAKSRKSKIPNSKNNSRKSVKAPKKKTVSKAYSLCKNLNIYEEGEKPSLADFLNDYNVTSNQTRNLLFVHYLKEIKEEEKVGIDEIYTCYKMLNLKIPKIEQGLFNTANRTGWLDTASLEELTITLAGENAVSHELRKTQEAA